MPNSGKSTTSNAAKMSFYSSLCYYRPRSPAPRVTGSDLARFVAQLQTSRAFGDEGLFVLNVKFGAAIDQDDLGTSFFEGEGVVQTVREIEWDLDPGVKCLDDIVRELRPHDRTIYRGHLMLGSATSSIMNQVARKNSPENSIDLCLDTWSFQLGLCEIGDLESEEFQVGWMDLSLHGSGYLFPWTLRDLVARAQACPEVLTVMELCRSTWPVPSVPPTDEHLQMRRRMAQLWPYDDLSKPWDWYWGVSESG